MIAINENQEPALSRTGTACAKYSGRVGQSAAAKLLDETAVRLAVAAHVRHVETPYDKLLMNGWERREARAHVHGKVESVLTKWKGVLDGLFRHHQ